MQMAPIWLLQLYCFIRNILPKLICSSTAVRRFVLPQLSVYLWPWWRPHGTSGLWLRWMDPPNVPNPASFTNKRIEKRNHNLISLVLFCRMRYYNIQWFQFSCIYFIVTEISFCALQIISVDLFSHLSFSLSLVMGCDISEPFFSVKLVELD